jgi:hypothetical protein
MEFLIKEQVLLKVPTVCPWCNNALREPTDSGLLLRCYNQQCRTHRGKWSTSIYKGTFLCGVKKEGQEENDAISLLLVVWSVERLLPN